MKLMAAFVSLLVPCAVAASETAHEHAHAPAAAEHHEDAHEEKHEAHADEHAVQAAGHGESHNDHKAHVEIKIPEPVAAQYVDLPNQCFQLQKFPCAVQTLTRGELKWGGVTLQAKPDAKLLFLGPELLQIVDAKVWMRGLTDHNIKFGELIFKADGDLLVERKNDRMDVNCLKGEVQVTGPARQNGMIPAGFQNWYRGLDAKAGMEQGVIRSSDPKAFIAAWLEIVGGGHPRFQALLKSYRDDQKTAVEESGKLYRDVIELRQLASKTEDKAREEALKRQSQDSLKYRQMFRDRFYGSEDPES